MSAATEAAHIAFSDAMSDPHNLISMHEHSRTGKGRRHRETTLNRAAVVLCVAAWQAYVGDTVKAILDDLAISAGQPGHAEYLVLKGLVSGSLGRFNTPNAYNSRGLLNSVGFDPQSSWSFTLSGPNRTYGAASVEKELDEWLAVRHAIAHGSDLPRKPVLTGWTKAGATIRKRDTERCIDFFEHVVGTTAAAAYAQFP
jgi:hypothetical protein